MNILLPSIDKEDKINFWKPMHLSEQLIPQFIAKNTKDMICLINKLPVWSLVHNAYYLQFDKRVASPSIKNFQIIDPLYRNLCINHSK